MGVPEEAGKVATSAIEALKGSPSCLAAILLTALFAILIYLALVSERHEMHVRQMSLIEACFTATTGKPFGGFDHGEPFVRGK